MISIMRENKYHLLCTNAVGQSLIEKAAGQGIYFHVLPFIDTESVPGFEPGEIISDLSRQPITAVFTSQNAVEAVKASLDNFRPPLENLVHGRCHPKIDKTIFW